jgi:hypothetical protein
MTLPVADHYIGIMISASGAYMIIDFRASSKRKMPRSKL